MVSHDATTGYWDPSTQAIQEPPPPHNLDSLGYLSGLRRSQILFGNLASHFQVLPETGKGANLLVHYNKICSVEKPDFDTLKTQLTWVRNYADLREDRIPEITIQTEDIVSFFGSLSFLNASRRGKTLELLSLVQMLAIHLEMQVKHYCWSPRPIDLAKQVQPIIQTPDHSTFPSGHATEAYAMATVLHRLEEQESPGDGIEKRAMPFRVAHRIAVNRCVAGVHYPVDSAAGAILGCAIGEAFYGVAMGGSPVRLSYGSEGALLPAEEDFTQAWLAGNFATAKRGRKQTGKIERSALIHQSWNAAQNEWRSGES